MILHYATLPYRQNQSSASRNPDRARQNEIRRATALKIETPVSGSASALLSFPSKLPARTSGVDLESRLGRERDRDREAYIISLKTRVLPNAANDRRNGRGQRTHPSRTFYRVGLNLQGVNLCMEAAELRETNEAPLEQRRPGRVEEATPRRVSIANAGEGRGRVLCSSQCRAGSPGDQDQMDARMLPNQGTSGPRSLRLERGICPQSIRPLPQRMRHRRPLSHRRQK